MKRRGWFFAIAIVCLLTAAACGRDAAPQNAGGHPKEGAAEEKHWGYEDGPHTVGPASWGDLPGDEPCKVGRLQSPIALATSGAGAAASAKEPTLSFDYRPVKLSMVNNGHTVQVNYQAGSSVSEAGTSYGLAQFHFHAPSEHTLNGKSFPLEIHLVHLDAAGKPALVVGVFAQEGAANAALDTALRGLPSKKGETSEPAGAMIDASGILPAARTHFAYDGSLTTPACTEGVRWRVMREPIEMSTAQIDAFRSLPAFAHTNRPLQPVGARSIVLVTAP